MSGKVLLDTEAFILIRFSSPKLTAKAKRAFLREDTTVYLSMVSLWELAIKIGLGKLELDVSLDDAIKSAVRAGVQLLPLDVRHVLAVQALPFHHRDPFDRMLVAQAETERLSIIASDAAFDDYGIERIW